MNTSDPVFICFPRTSVFEGSRFGALEVLKPKGKSELSGSLFDTYTHVSCGPPKITLQFCGRKWRLCSVYVLVVAAILLGEPQLRHDMDNSDQSLC